MPAQSHITDVAGRRLFSKLFLLCALGAALLLAACAQTGAASSLTKEIGGLAVSGATPDAQGFVLAGQITPSAPTPGAGGTAAAPALFGGQITEIVSNGGENVWQVAGRAVHVTSATIINNSVGQPQIGTHVTVGGTPRSDGSVDAAWIRVDAVGAAATPVLTVQAPATATGAPAATARPQAAASPTAQATQAPRATEAPNDANAANNASQAASVYCGFLEQLPQSGIVGDWRVSNRTVHVGQDTRIQAQGNRFDLGWFTYVRGVLQGDGSLNAQQIFVRPPENNRCLPGLRVGQNNGIGQGNDNRAGVGNGPGNNGNQGDQGNGKGKQGNPGKGNGGGKGPKPGKGKGH